MKKYEQILCSNSSIPTHTESQKEEEKTVENTCEKVKAQNFPNLMRKTLIYIFKKLNKFQVKTLRLQTQTHHNQTVERTQKTTERSTSSHTGAPQED